MQFKHTTGAFGAAQNNDIAKRIFAGDGTPIAHQARGQGGYRLKGGGDIVITCRRICDSGAPAQQSLVSALQDPNGWDEVTPSDFGPEHDYELENHITKWTVTAVSKAALEWCHAHLSADTPRWGADGFVIEAERLNRVVKGMTRDGLMSPEEYERAMQEAHMVMLQGDDDEQY